MKQMKMKCKFKQHNELCNFKYGKQLASIFFIGIEVTPCTRIPHRMRGTSINQSPHGKFRPGREWKGKAKRSQKYFRLSFPF